MEFAVLSSGSRANSLYIQSSDTRVLVDCGLSARATQKRLQAIGVDPSSIDAIVVSHEHTDHIAGIRVFAKKYPCRVLVNRQTKEKSDRFEEIDDVLFSEFENGVSFDIGNLLFEPFSVVHDAIDPGMFRISTSSACLAIITDLGQVTNLVREHAKNVDALIIEANHDPELLMDAPYPWEVKQRIKSRTGHLSNEAAGKFLEELSNTDDGRLQFVIGAHLSEKSNIPELAHEALISGWKRGGSVSEPAFHMASAKESLPLIRLGKAEQKSEAANY